MILDYTIRFGIKDEPTYRLCEILFEHDAFDVEDSEIPIFEPSDAYEEALAYYHYS